MRNACITTTLVWLTMVSRWGTPLLWTLSKVLCTVTGYQEHEDEMGREDHRALLEAPQG